MKRFLSTTAFVVSLAMLFILSPNQSLTAESNSATNQPIKVLGVKLNTEQATWLDTLELQIQNTSRKSIKYLLVHAELAGTTSGTFLRVPLIFGQAPGSKTRAAELLQPGARITLKPAKAVCDRMRNEIVASGRIPSPKDFKTSINVVFFEDTSAWKAGYLNYQDPNNSSKWIAVEDPARSMFQKAGYKPAASKQTCFRYTGFSLEFCCDSNFVANANFVSDPNGNVQPVEAEACCGSGNCCFYTDIGFCP
ncbi:MAG TPA: hypothetical protein VK893_10085 [Pyrinomonadaceae bacterium]|nr:hypothetical protein [Pyrinomonadaceae bacterium]